MEVQDKSKKQTKTKNYLYTNARKLEQTSSYYCPIVSESKGVIAIGTDNKDAS